MYILVCFLTMVMGHDTTVNGEKWCYTNGSGQCKINGRAHPCPTCGNYAQNGCSTYPSTTSPDGMSRKKDYDVPCPDTTPKAGNTCIKEKCFGYVFECIDGYVVEKTGKREYDLTCSKGQYQWPTCVEAKCTPGNAPNATPASTKEISVGQKVEYKCKPGFARKGGERKYSGTCASDGKGGQDLDDVTGCSEKLGCMSSSAINFVSDATMDDPANPCHECETSADCGENASCESNKCKCKPNHAGEPGKGERCFINCGGKKCLQREACIDSSGKVFCACGKSADYCTTVTPSPEEPTCDTLTKYACDYKSGCSWDKEKGMCVSGESIVGAYKKDDDDSTSWGLIGGILLLALLLLLCCCFLACMWWRKRERKQGQGEGGFAEDRRHGMAKDQKRNLGSSAGSVGSSRSHHKSSNKGGSSKNKMNSSSRTQRNRGIE